MPLAPDTNGYCRSRLQLQRGSLMISRRARKAARSWSDHPLGSSARVVVLIAVSIAALLFLDSTRLLAEEERPPFLTMEDQRRCIVKDENCFNWIYQKALIGRLV